MYLISWILAQKFFNMPVNKHSKWTQEQMMYCWRTVAHKIFGTNQWQLEKKYNNWTSCSKSQINY